MACSARTSSSLYDIQQYVPFRQRRMTNCVEDFARVRCNENNMLLCGQVVSDIMYKKLRYRRERALQRLALHIKWP